MVVVKMYVLLVYDINAERVGKACKLCRRYLNWVQNSVFEGEISEAKLEKLKISFKKIIDLKEDSLLIYSHRSKDMFSREVIGIEKQPTENIV